MNPDGKSSGKVVPDDQGSKAKAAPDGSFLASQRTFAPDSEDYVSEEIQITGPLQQRALALVGHPRFDALIGMLICINAICLGVETDHPNPKKMWTGIEIGFLIFFSSELLVRLIAWQGRFFRDGWCLFDTGLVGASLVDVAVSGSLPNLTLLRITRLLRLVRAVRLIKVLRPLYLLLQGLINNATAMFWVLFLMILILYVFAIVCTRGIGNNVIFVDTEIQAKFSSVSTSMFSLCVLMTFEDWYNSYIIPVLFEMPIMVPVFIVFLGLTTFSVLNVLCGLFVSSILLAAESQADEIEGEGAEERKKERLRGLQEVFSLGDVNHDGVMTVPEFQDFVRQPKVANALRQLGIRAKDACELFNLLDADHNASLKVGEFIFGCARLCDKASGRDIVLSTHVLKQQVSKMQEQTLTQQKRSETQWKEANERLDAVDAYLDRIATIYNNGQGRDVAKVQDQRLTEDHHRRIDELSAVLDGALSSRFARNIGPKNSSNPSPSHPNGSNGCSMHDGA